MVARAYLKLRRLKLFVLAQDAVGLVRGVRKQNADYDPSATLMERMVGAKAIPWIAGSTGRGHGNSLRTSIASIRRPTPPGSPS